MNIIGPGNIHTKALNGFLTVGTFDGLHLGHQHVLEQLKNFSEENDNAPTSIITFSNHPRSVLFPDNKVEQLSTLDEKLELFDKSNIDYVYLIEFTGEFAMLTPQLFVEQHIVPFGPRGIIVGREHFFGKNKEGNFDVLYQLGQQFGFDVFEAKGFTLNGVNVSSSEIRKLIQEGNLEKASAYLGYPYFFSGKVVEGNRIGAELGYPTANLKLHDLKLIPAPGVYAAYAEINETVFPGMLYIGTRPTFEQNQLSIEMNVFNFSDNLYSQIIRIIPVKQIREDKKFSNREELINCIKKDELTTKQILKI